MFGIGFQEVLIIALLALIVFGPRRLLNMIGELSRLADEARHSVNEFQSELVASEKNEPRREAGEAEPMLLHSAENGDKPSSNGSKRGAAFELGEQDVSEGVETLMERIGSSPVKGCLRRHQVGDWGEIDDENRHLNGLSLGEGGSLGFESAYRMEDGTVLRILTFEDCSGTLLLTDEEYHQALLSMDKEYP
jgi:Sec-independent protein translocase protein TatA